MGLLPRRINAKWVKAHYEGPLFGIWLWATRPTDENHVLALLSRAVLLPAMRIDLLRVCYPIDSRVRSKDGRNIKITVPIELGNYENGDQKAYIITQTIAPWNVERIATYDLVKLLAKE